MLTAVGRRLWTLLLAGTLRGMLKDIIGQPSAGGSAGAVDVWFRSRFPPVTKEVFCCFLGTLEVLDPVLMKTR